MEDKRLDFDAPLLSVRRFSSPARPPAGVNRREAERRASLPFYKADLKSGPVSRPGIVPFVWEHTPGRPKDGPPPVSVRTRPKPPPGRILHENLENGTESSGKVASVSSVSGGDVVGTEEVKLEKKKEVKKEEKRAVPAEPDGGEEDDVFSDALDTLSRTESFFMNCSVSGLTGGADAGLPPSGLFSTDPQVRDFMMGRFLPAAQAMASSSPQCASRKPVAQTRESARMRGRDENEENGESRRPLPVSHHGRANYGLQHAHEQQGSGLGVKEDNDDDDDDDAEEDYGGDLSKACGMLPKFCMKSSFFLMNPVPGMKVRGRLRPPRSHRVNGQQNRNLDNAASLGQAGDEFSWEAVYKHKLGHGNRFQLENESKLTSESYQLTNWSDSPDGSSPYRRSGGDGISPYRNEAPSSPFHEGKGFLGVPGRERKSSKGNSVESFEKDGEHYWEMTPRDSSTKGSGSGSMSPAIEKTLYVDSVYVPETRHSKSSSVGTTADMQAVFTSDDKGSEVETGSRSLDEIMPLESFKLVEFQDKIAEAVEMEFPICNENPYHLDFGRNKEIKGSEKLDVPLASEAAVHAKNNGNPLQPLIPPPLPKSPSESWLLRTLPSVSSRNPPPQSLLGIQVQPRKQPLRGSSTDVKPETKVKPVKQHRQIQFAEVLTKPVSPQ